MGTGGRSFDLFICIIVIGALPVNAIGSEQPTADIVNQTTAYATNLVAANANWINACAQAIIVLAGVLLPVLLLMRVRARGRILNDTRSRSGEPLEPASASEMAVIDDGLATVPAPRIGVGLEILPNLPRILLEEAIQSLGELSNNLLHGGIHNVLRPQAKGELILRFINYLESHSESLAQDGEHQLEYRNYSEALERLLHDLTLFSIDAIAKRYVPFLQQLAGDLLDIPEDEEPVAPAPAPAMDEFGQNLAATPNPHRRDGLMIFNSIQMRLQ